VGLAPAGEADDPAYLLMPSVVDCSFVPLLGLRLRLPANPADPPLENPADVLGWKLDPKWRLINSAARGAVHSSVRHSWASDPYKITPSGSANWVWSSRGVRPGWGLEASWPRSSRAAFTRLLTEERQQPRKRATSSRNSPAGPVRRRAGGGVGVRGKSR
jgi:hypothetical protein